LSSSCEAIQLRLADAVMLKTLTAKSPETGYPRRVPTSDTLRISIPPTFARGNHENVVRSSFGNNVTSKRDFPESHTMLTKSAVSRIQYASGVSLGSISLASVQLWESAESVCRLRTAWTR